MKRLASFGLGALAFIMPGAAAAQASLVTLKTAPSASAEDYPRRAVMAEVEGSVVVEIAVDPTGAPTACTPIEIETPGFGLEDATCKIWMQRARFSPGRNASGVAIPGTVRAQHNWVLAEPEPEPPVPAIARPIPVPRLPANPELACSGPSTFERWGAGTGFPANNKPPRNGPGELFQENYRINAESGEVEVFKKNSSYGLVRSMEGYTPGSYNVVNQDGFSLRWTSRSRWDYNVFSYTVRHTGDGNFSYSYLSRYEDRNRLIFELYKSTGTCRLLNPT
jgi:Gram-negative bacterial TonB protein C-terminal